jgi:hypothetical protein
LVATGIKDGIARSRRLTGKWRIVTIKSRYALVMLPPFFMRKFEISDVNTGRFPAKSRDWEMGGINSVKDETSFMFQPSR